MFGGLSGTVSWKSSGKKTLAENWVCAVCHAIWPEDEEDGTSDNGGGGGGKMKSGRNEQFIRLDRDVYIPDVINASDVVLGKIGYGSVSECVFHRTPLIYVPRENFAEEPELKQVLERHETCVEMSAKAFASGEWREAIEKASALRPSFEGEADGGRKCARTVLDYLRRDAAEASRTKRAECCAANKGAATLLEE